jgi:hypothetical protein
LHIDLGCGDGSYILECAKAHTDMSWLGLDLQWPPIGVQPPPDEAAAAFLVCNCHQLAALGRLIQRLKRRSLPLGSASVVLPWHWTKARHAARRLLSAALLDMLHTHLAPGGRLLFAFADVARADDARALLNARADQWREVADDFPPACGGAVGAVVIEVRVVRV